MSDALTPRSGWTAALIALIGIAALSISTSVDPQIPGGAEWLIAGILAGVGLAGHLIGLVFGATASTSAPPWDVHTVWILPAALLTPPAAFLPVLGLSLILTALRRQHRAAIRVVVGSITAITTAAIHLLAMVIDSPLWAGLAGTVALWVIGLIVALVASNLFLSPTGAALWLDYRWSLVQLGCAFSGIIVALAMTVDPWGGILGLAPLLLAAFALHWPELERHARIDSKTGLPNARHWEDRSRDLILAAELKAVPVSVLIIDLDHFKTVNDTYGHLVGDDVLERVAGVLRSQINPGDVPGRFGGEEFVVTLFSLTEEETAAAADRIRQAIGGQQFRARPRGVDIPAADTFAVTCTIGTASSGARGYDLTTLLASADEALTVGKEGGRNRVTSAGGAADQNTVGPWTVATRKSNWIAVANQQQRSRADRN